MSSRDHSETFETHTVRVSFGWISVSITSPTHGLRRFIIGVERGLLPFQPIAGLLSILQDAYEVFQFLAQEHLEVPQRDPLICQDPDHRALQLGTLEDGALFRVIADVERGILPGVVFDLRRSKVEFDARFIMTREPPFEILRFVWDQDALGSSVAELKDRWDVLQTESFGYPTSGRSRDTSTPVGKVLTIRGLQIRDRGHLESIDVDGRNRGRKVQRKPCKVFADTALEQDSVQIAELLQQAPSRIIGTFFEKQDGLSVFDSDSTITRREKSETFLDT